MAGHSKFKNIMHRKGRQDAKRAKVFAKLGKELSVAARGGSDPDFNPRLRLAVAAAKAQNMPNDNIKRAIQRAEAGDAADYEEIRYEGYGPGGVAVIVEALTDNRNRTASEVRSAFAKHGGNLGETNSVAFMFDQIGQVVYAADVANADDMFEAALEAGAADVASGDNGHDITCAPDDFGQVVEALDGRFGAPESASLTWKPQTSVDLNADSARTLLKLIDTLDDSDDVQRVSANFEVSDDVMAELTV